MKCPKCEGGLHEHTFGKVKVDQCDSCTGVWFDVKEVRSLIAHANRTLELPTSEVTPESQGRNMATGTCPRCDVLLTRVESLAISGLSYDQCMTCRGAWLDAGELDQIAHDPDAANEIHFFNEFD